MLDLYTDYLSAAGCTERTVSARVAGARGLMRLANTEDPSAITMTDALRYIASVPARSSRATYYAHVRTFARFCAAVDIPVYFTNGLPAVRHPRGTPRPINSGELTAALHNADRASAMMLRLAALAGLRVSEIARVCGEDVGEQIEVAGKGDRVDLIPTHPAIRAAATRFPSFGPWFTWRSQPVSRQYVWRRMTEALRAVGSTATPHQCRHYYGTSLLDAGNDIRTVQELLRHSSLATTQVYTRVTDRSRRAAIDSLADIA